MKFVVGDVIGEKNNCFHLIRSSWNDWWEYEILYRMIYYNQNQEGVSIGSVKIAQKDMTQGQKVADLPSVFERLDGRFFSLGQTDDYYENIKNLGDNIRIEVLTALQDIAFDKNLFESIKNEHITRTSLMREVREYTISYQFSKIAQGNARLTKFNFEYIFPTEKTNNPARVEFLVEPESNPPTNVHVIIGRNNVGKTTFIKNLISAANKLEDNQIKYGQINEWRILHTGERHNQEFQSFANVLCFAFSPFDSYKSLIENIGQSEFPLKYIGLEKSITKKDEIGDGEIELLSLNETLNNLFSQFFNSIYSCVRNMGKTDMLLNTLEILETDPIFDRSQISDLVRDATTNYSDRKTFRIAAKKVFDKLSSGHRVVLISIVNLIDQLVERTLVIFDEPENHLHPPLLAAFIRAVSMLLIRKNGVAIIATHSPVILQEVPKKCVWKLTRNGAEMTATRPEIETFGGNIGSLTREVFGHEVYKSGFHSLLKKYVDQGKSFEEILRIFNRELGDEALALLNSLVFLRG